MILARLDLKAFGRFTDVSLDLSAGPRRFHLVYGPNESGKSTSLRAITSLLFGIPHLTEDNFLHANTQLRIGGLLVEGEQELDCVRRKGKKATLRDAQDDQPLDESFMESMLGGIRRETFLTRFGLSHDELVAGGAAILSGEGDLGQILFSAGAGIGRLRQIQDELDEVASALFTPRGTKTSIAKSIQKLEEQRSELKRSQVPPAQYRDLTDRLETRRTEAARLGKQIEQSLSEHNRLRHFQQALPLIPRWRSTIESLKACRDTPRLDEAFTERRRQAVSDREVARSRHTELLGRITEMSSRLEAIPVDEAIIRHQTEIQSVFQEVAARSKADRDREGLFRNRSNVDRKIADLLGQLTVDVPAHQSDEHWTEVMEQAIEKLKVPESIRNRIRQLGSSYEKLISQRNEASDFVESTKRRLNDLSEELESLGTPEDPILICNAIDAVGNPQGMLESVAEQRETNETLGQRCERLLRRLDGFEGTLDEAVELNLPAGEQLRSLADAMERAGRKLESAQQQRDERSREHEELALQLRQQQSELPLPTVAELIQARQQRDAVVTQLRQQAAQGVQSTPTELTAAIDELCRRIDLADRLTDTMRSHHQQIHQREQGTIRLTRLNEQLNQCDAELATASKRLAEAQQQWDAIWTQVGVRPGAPAQMQRWMTDHELLCETCNQWRDGEKRLEQLQHRIQVAAARLSKALSNKSRPGARTRQTVGPDTYQGSLFDEAPEDNLISLYDEALAARSESTQRRQAFESLRRRREELAEELPKAETRLETAQRQVEQWRDEWQRITESFTGSERIGTDEVSLMLEQITELHNKKRERDILVRRIHSIGEDDAEFQSRVERLVASTKTDFSAGTSPTVIAQELYQRLQSARTAIQTRDTLREQIELSKQRMAEAQSQQQACEAVLKQLCMEANCESPDQLPEIEQVARRRAELEGDLRELENQLSILAGDNDLAEFIRQAGQQQPGPLENQIAECEVAMKELRERQSEWQQEIGAIQHELRRIDGSGRASELVQTIQFTAGELARDCEEFARAKVASIMLRRAIDHYRTAHQSPILQHANKYFRQLTCESYRELRPDYDAKGRSTLFGIRAGGEAVPAANMSDGTADALYLALRLASLEYQIGLSKPIPLVIDDCLIQLDDDRASAALQAFSDLSETTQVILFTHHQHVVDLARNQLRQGDFHLHRLDVSRVW